MLDEFTYSRNLQPVVTVLAFEWAIKVAITAVWFFLGVTIDVIFVCVSLFLSGSIPVMQVVHHVFGVMIKI